MEVQSAPISSVKCVVTYIIIMEFKGRSRIGHLERKWYELFNSEKRNANTPDKFIGKFVQWRFAVMNMNRDHASWVFCSSHATLLQAQSR